jgi:murein DD-endopeptidase MepM/ murein hydrolase activator NlpD
MKKLNGVYGLVCTFLLIFLPIQAGQAGIWVRPIEVKQGEIIIVSGLFYPFGNQNVLLQNCQMKFAGQTYKFAREIVDFKVFRESSEQAGFQYIARIPTSPLSQIGYQEMILDCAADQQKNFKVKVLEENFPLQHITLSGSKNSLQRTEIEDQAVNGAIKHFSLYKLWDSSKSWLEPNKARRSAAYGLRRTYNGQLAANYFHKGVDYAAFTGSQVVAPARGKVILAGYEKSGFAVHGNCLFIDHGQGVISAYLHLSEIQVEQGQEVQAGQLIGKVGATGIATGPHLHFGVYVNGHNVNPDPWLQHAIP